MGTDGLLTLFLGIQGDIEDLDVGVVGFDDAGVAGLDGVGVEMAGFDGAGGVADGAGVVDGAEVVGIDDAVDVGFDDAGGVNLDDAGVVNLDDAGAVRSDDAEVVVLDYEKYWKLAALATVGHTVDFHMVVVDTEEHS
uniref:Uncharacterized protein n=1 Tax=Arion vulgaris TaxID=1028688 RepID=A0A0B6ZSM5_9EUPU